MKQNMWKVIKRPGYFGSKKGEMENEWNQTYGLGNWRVSWVTAEGKHLSYEDIIDIYIDGYANYFIAHPDEAAYITSHFSYGFDLDFQTKKEAFDMYALFEKPGKRNQFHQVAFNIALENRLQLPFRGKNPVQVRDAKPGTPENERPLGWKWNPGVIPCPHPEQIPTDIEFVNPWWEKGSIEDFYQSTKVLEVREKH